MVHKTKRKRTHTQFRVDVPQQDATVTRVEVTRGVNQQILTKSTKVSVPIAEDVPTEHQPFQALENPPPSPDDDLAPTAKKARKKPSRSVSVCSRVYSSLTRNDNHLYRQCLNSGCHSRMSSPTGSSCTRASGSTLRPPFAKLAVRTMHLTAVQIVLHLCFLVTTVSCMSTRVTRST